MPPLVLEERLAPEECYERLMKLKETDPQTLSEKTKRIRQPPALARKSASRQAQ